MGDAGVVEPPARGGPESIDPGRERFQRAIDQLENLGVVGVRLQKAQGLVQAKERSRVADDGAVELLQEHDLARPIVGRVTGAAAASASTRLVGVM